MADDGAAAGIGHNGGPAMEIPGKIVEVFFDPLTGDYIPSRFKVLYGGRGSAKSESVGRLLINEARQIPGRILCTRQFQNSIADSVHKTLSDIIYEMEVAHEFVIEKATIRHKVTGADFIFKGMQRAIGEIKSMKGLRRAWVEEAASVSKEGWQVLEATLRIEGSEIWVTYNPDQETDATHQLLVIKPVWNTRSSEVNWRDNPWFPAVLDESRLACFEKDPDAYDWIWEGKPRKITAAVIFRNRVDFKGFTELTEEEILRRGGRIFNGLDFGFANDPNAAVRCYTLPDETDPSKVDLFVTHAQFGYHVELDDLPAFLEGGDSGDKKRSWTGVPGFKRWPIKADGSRPETISKIAGSGFPVSAADKWPGSVEDGIAHLKSFRMIYVQGNLKELAEEFRLYAYKTDPKRLDEKGEPEILPIIVDRWNHGIDAIRYALDGYITRGGIGVWARL